MGLGMGVRDRDRDSDRVRARGRAKIRARARARVTCLVTLKKARRLGDSSSSADGSSPRVVSVRMDGVGVRGRRVSYLLGSVP